MKPIALALLAAAPLLLPRGVTAADQPVQPASVSVVSLGDFRGGGSFSRLEIELALPGIRASEVAATRLTVTQAIDDTGRDLVPEDSRKPPLEPVHQVQAGDPGETPAPAVVTVKLRNPARKAKTIAEIAGVIELYLPGRDPGAVAIIPEIATWAGKSLQNPSLAAGGVRITMLTEEQLDAQRERQTDERREEARKHGVLGEMLESMASEFSKAFFAPERGDVILQVDDPQTRVVRMALLDAAGEDQTSGWSRQQGFSILSSTRRGPGPGWSLQVHLTTPKTAERLSFALKDLRLP